MDRRRYSSAIDFNRQYYFEAIFDKIQLNTDD
jgi:hypothetical protein